jgi:broad specificity phosphatase PhoE
MRIYIRHAEKEYDNGKAINYKHDPGITEIGKLGCIETAKELISKYGLPDLIICSPYRRARETANLMNSYLISIGKPSIIYCDKSISEYLGNHRNVKLDVTEDTLKFNPPHPENFHQMKERVKTHNMNITQNYNINMKRTWIITHGLIIKEIAKLYDIVPIKHIPPLGYYIPMRQIPQLGYHMSFKSSDQLIKHQTSEV